MENSERISLIVRGNKWQKNKGFSVIGAQIVLQIFLGSKDSLLICWSTELAIDGIKWRNVKRLY